MALNCCSSLETKEQNFKKSHSLIFVKLPRKSSIELILSKSLIFFVQIYQVLFSGIFGGACKFYPSCSNYAVEALRTHGIFRGVFLIFFRLSKCHPFNFKSGIDLVPERNYGKSEQ
jgi:putative membrane protein insertion efficiency factor